MNEDNRKYGINIQYFSKTEYGFEPYDYNLSMKLDSDITAGDAILAFVRVLNASGYHVTSDTLEQVAFNMKEDNQ